MAVVKIQSHLTVLRNVNDLPQFIYKQILSVREKNFGDQRMGLGEIFGDFFQRTADFRQLYIIHFPHSRQDVAFQEIQERQPNGSSLGGNNNRRSRIETR